jgi:hypothetical protein
MQEGHKTNLELKKPCCVLQRNVFIDGLDRADQYLNYYSILRKTVKCMKMMIFFVIYALLNAFFVYKIQNKNHNINKISALATEVLGIKNKEAN